MISTGGESLVSVIMPVYNGEKYLREAINSVLEQSFTQFEFIIVDDGSTDKSLEIIQGYRDERIRLLVNETNCGVAFSLNRAIRCSKGDYIVRMDGDDIAYPKRLETQIRFFKANPSIDLCGSYAMQFGAKKGLFRFPKVHEQIVAQHLFNPAFIHPTVCWRSAALKENGFIYTESPPTAEDYDLWVRVSQKHKMANIDKPLLYYRIDPSIKVSGYIKQQYAGARHIRRTQLEEWCDLSEKEFDLHHQISEGSIEPSLELLLEAGRLLNKILLKNESYGRLDHQALNVVVREYWYRVIVAHIHANFAWKAIAHISSQINISLSFRHHIALVRHRLLNK